MYSFLIFTLFLPGWYCYLHLIVQEAVAQRGSETCPQYPSSGSTHCASPVHADCALSEGSTVEEGPVQKQKGQVCPQAQGIWGNSFLLWVMLTKGFLLDVPCLAS